MSNLSFKEKEKLADKLSNPVIWGETYLQNRDGSPRKYWPHQIEDLLCQERNIIHLDGRDSPDHIDPAILRPGRIDRKIFMGPPSRTGRIVLLNKLLSRMPTADDVQPEILADLTHGLSALRLSILPMKPACWPSKNPSPIIPPLTQFKLMPTI